MTKDELLKDRAFGHAELWDCTFDEFVEKVIPTIQKHQFQNKLKPKVIKTAIDFLHIHFNNKELKGTIEYEVCRAIEETFIYYVNCLGEDI